MTEDVKATSTSKKPMVITVLTAVAALGTAATAYYEHKASEAGAKTELVQQQLFSADAFDKLADEIDELASTNHRLEIEIVELRGDLKLLASRSERRSGGTEAAMTVEPPPAPSPTKIKLPKRGKYKDDPRVKAAVQAMAW